jgi:hypothetical protein
LSVSRMSCWMLSASSSASAGRPLPAGRSISDSVLDEPRGRASICPVREGLLAPEAMRGLPREWDAAAIEGGLGDCFGGAGKTRCLRSESRFSVAGFRQTSTLPRGRQRLALRLLFTGVRGWDSDSVSDKDSSEDSSHR